MSTFLSPATGNLVGKRKRTVQGGEERVKRDPKCTEHPDASVLL